jgi:hypothetical protein
VTCPFLRSRRTGSASGEYPPEGRHFPSEHTTRRTLRVATTGSRMSPSWRVVRGRPIPSPWWPGPEEPDRVRRSDLRGRDIAAATRSRLDPPALAIPAPFPQARSPFEAFPSCTARWRPQVALSLRTRSPWPLPSRRCLAVAVEVPRWFPPRWGTRAKLAACRTADLKAFFRVRVRCLHTACAL